MLRPGYPSFRSVQRKHAVVRVAGAHHALSGLLAQEAGFHAVWSSSFELSAVRCLPDASLLSMNEYLQAAASMQKSLSIPVVADCDTGYGGNLNVAHMVHEFESAGITAICVEDKQFPKLNSFATGDHRLLDAGAFAKKVMVAKRSQSSAEFYVIARTEALVVGRNVGEALYRCRRYADAGADAVLVHSKADTCEQILEFLAGWDTEIPVVVVPTTYPAWHVDDVARAGAAVVIYANQGLRASVESLRRTYRAIFSHGESACVESDIASIADIFELQRLGQWQELDR